MINEIKKQFPFFHNHPEMVYLDNASTTQTPQCVLDAMNDYYTTYRANIHRGVYGASETASEAYEHARVLVADFLHTEAQQIIFTRSTTESINLVAWGWAKQHISKGDEILVSELEHHANFVPWYELCKQTGATLRVIPIKDDMTLDIDVYETMLSGKVKLVCVSAISNVTGTINNIPTLVNLAHKYNAKVMVDGAQAIAHEICNMTQWDVDFFGFSGHKMYGPTGIGVLYGKKELLETTQPFLYGGGIITTVSANNVEYSGLPTRLEGGTPPIAEAIGLGAAIQFIQDTGLHAIMVHEADITQYTYQALSRIKDLTLFHPTQGSGILSFSIKGIHPHDIASILDAKHIAIRAGHHCAQPLHDRLCVSATARVSLGIYNSKEDIDKLVKALHEIQEKFS